MIKFSAILVFTFLLILSGISQSDFNKRLKYAREKDENIVNQINRLKEVLIDLESTGFYDTIGFGHYFISFRYLNSIQDYQKAILHAEKAKLAFQKGEYNGERKARVSNYIIDAWSRLEKHQKVIDYFENEYNPSEFYENPEELHIGIRSVAASYREMGDASSALFILEDFLANYTTHTYPKDLANIYLEKSIVERELGMSVQALNSLDIGRNWENLVEEGNRDPKRIFNYVNQEALIALDQGKYEKARQIYNSHISKVSNKEHQVLLAGNTFVALSMAEDYTQAHNYAIKSFTESQQIEEDSILYKNLAIDNLACSYMYLGKMDSSQYYFDMGIKLLTNQNDLPPMESLKNSSHKKKLCNLLYDQARKYRQEFKLTGDIEKLKEARNIMISLDSLIALYIEDQILEGSVLNLKKELSKYYQEAVDISYQLGLVDDFIFFSEKNRGLLLLTHLRQTTYKDATLANQWLSELGLLKSEKREIQYILNENYSDSHQNLLALKNREILKKETDLKSIQNQGSEIRFNVDKLIKGSQNQARWYYQFGSRDLYAIKWDNNKAEIINLIERDSLVTMLSNYLNNLKAGRFQKFETNLSSQLYKILVSKIKNKNDNILIFPDEELCYLSFESLQNPQGEFLIESCNISYSMSMTLHEEWTKDRIPIRNISIISPDYDTSLFKNWMTSYTKSGLDYKFSPLIFSKKEVATLEVILDALLYEGTAATKEIFLSSLNSADIIHFSGHAILYPENNPFSFLALGQDFKNHEEKLTMGELYDQRTKAELVVLNACNTGQGKLIKGEGVFNLSRAFFSAGAQSTVSTLWEIDDRSSSQIMISFYTYLKKGYSKSSALRKAKLDYLQNITQDQKAHPYYWAGLILIGDPAALRFGTNTLDYAWIFGLIILLGCVWIFHKNKIKSS